MTAVDSAPIHASRTYLRYKYDGGDLTAVDIAFDGRRIWSTTPTWVMRDSVFIMWPRALRPFLRGKTTVSVRSSSDGKLLAAGPVRFDVHRAPTEVRDSDGNHLVVNKWRRMGVTLEEHGSDFQNRLLTRTRELLDRLNEWGYAACITGGTLLGAVRLGSLLPLDDDTDLAVVLESDSPIELNLMGYRLEDQLIRAGYTVVRHSGSHLQVTFLEPDGRTDHYIDIFTGFFRNGEYCQPFHVRAPLDRSSILPLSTISINDRDFPAPAVPADWLRLCYGEDWRTPDPSFHFDTPLSTRSRFENWFGSFNRNRVFWEDHWSNAGRNPQELASEGMSKQHVQRLERIMPNAGPIVDLGSGTGSNSVSFAALGHQVTGVDYSYRALALAKGYSRRMNKSSEVEFSYLNLTERRRVLEFAHRLCTDKTQHAPWTLFANHLLEGLVVEARHNVYLMTRELSTMGGSLIAVIDTNIPMGFSYEDPRTWHLPLGVLEREIEKYGLVMEPLWRGIHRTFAGTRICRTVRIGLPEVVASQRRRSR